MGFSASYTRLNPSYADLEKLYLSAPQGQHSSHQLGLNAVWHDAIRAVQETAPKGSELDMAEIRQNLRNADISWGQVDEHGLDPSHAAEDDQVLARDAQKMFDEIVRLRALLLAADITDNSVTK
jgi:hypothetical protein